MVCLTHKISDRLVENDVVGVNYHFAPAYTPKTLFVQIRVLCQMLNRLFNAVLQIKCRQIITLTDVVNNFPQVS